MRRSRCRNAADMCSRWALAKTQMQSSRTIMPVSLVWRHCAPRGRQLLDVQTTTWPASGASAFILLSRLVVFSLSRPIVFVFSLVPRAQLPSQQLPSQPTPGTRGDLRQNAVRVIAVDPPIALARTRRLVADSSRKGRRNLAVDLRCPPCLRAFAIAIVTRRAETSVGWLGEERSDE